MGYIVYCMNNQKQVAVGLIQWGRTIPERILRRFPSTNGGDGRSFRFVWAVRSLRRPLELFGEGLSCLDLSVGQKRKSRRQIPVCSPMANVSYFFNLDAAPNQTYSFVSGDRHLEMNHKPVPPGLFYAHNEYDPGLDQGTAWHRPIVPRGGHGIRGHPHRVREERF